MNQNYVAGYNSAASLSMRPSIDVDPKDLQAVQLYGFTSAPQESQSVLMNHEDKYIFDEFRWTMPEETVEIIELKRVKDNVSRKRVYDELLKAKTEELKGKNVCSIERVLFHGTSLENVAKIVNNGFNRDFNTKHVYGKGTYFSSLASKSAEYSDRSVLQQMKVMLVCKVIVGEYCVGTQDMDGSTVPCKSDGKTQYESCVEKLINPTIFVINRDYHAIPTHIITFKYKQ